jgi:hypothetical protein
VIGQKHLNEGAEPMDLERLTRRLLTAELEIARAHAEIAVVRQQCQRLKRARILAGISVTVAATAIAGLLSTASTAAQGGGQKLTVKAPFTVVDSQNKPILVVDEGRRGLSVLGTDGNTFSGLFDEQTVLRAPLVVLDTANHPIVAVQNSSTSQVKDEKGEKKDVTANRGLHVFNDNGDAVARVAAEHGHGRRPGDPECHERRHRALADQQREAEKRRHRKQRGRAAIFR